MSMRKLCRSKISITRGLSVAPLGRLTEKRLRSLQISLGDSISGSFLQAAHGPYSSHNPTTGRRTEHGHPIAAGSSSSRTKVETSCGIYTQFRAKVERLST